MKKKFYFILGLIMVLFASCLDDTITLSSFPTTPGNIGVINTADNDYGESVAGFLYDDISFLISTDNDEGNLDIKNIYLSFQENNTNSLSFYLDENGYDYFDSALVRINTDEDELNPFTIYNNEHSSDAFIYVSENDDNYDIYYSFGDFDNKSWTGPNPLLKLNTNYNEKDFAYYNSTILYASDETGNYDIYKVDIPYELSLREWIDNTEPIQKSTFATINSDGNDICPKIIGNLLIFASDRSGGYGGYDLYYSHFYNGEWSAPVNFGAQINSEYDEINPIGIYYMNHKNDLMLFSSNRTGGKGGFDIYYVGIPSVID